MSFTWQKGTAVTGSGVYLKCIWAGGSINKFVAVGERTGVTKKIATSPDGITWTAQTVGQNNTWTGIAFDGTTLVAVSFTGVNRVMTSTDAVNWTVRSASEANAWADVCWSPSVTALGSIGQFVAVAETGTHRVMTSPDGINWTNQTAASALAWAAIDWSPSLQLYAATAQSTSASNIMTSPDGVTWTPRTNPLGGLVNMAQCGMVWAAGAGKFVAGVDTTANHVISSSDGLTWNDWSGVPTGWGSHPVSRIAWSPELSLFMAVSNDTIDNVLTSPDGSTWTTVQMTDGVTNFVRAWGCPGYSPTLHAFAIMLNADSADIVALGTGTIPAVDSITPSSGTLGGNFNLTLTSAGGNGGFAAGARVFIDWAMEGRSSGLITTPFNAATNRVVDVLNMNEATNVVVVDANHLTCTAPVGLSIYSLGIPGDRVPDVLVINTNSATPNIACYLPGGFTYLNPTLTSVTANTGPAGGGTVVTLTGTNLFGYGSAGATGGAANQTILFGSEPATSVTVNSATSITCTTPPAVSATNPVDVTFGGLVFSPVMFALGGYNYLRDAASQAVLPTSFTFTRSWFTLTDIPSAFIADAQLDLNSAILDWTDDLGSSVATYLATKYNRRKVNVPAHVPIHWYVYSLFRPGGLWSVTTEPTHYGWFQSVDGYTGASSLIIGDAPHDPRSFTEIASFAAGTAGMLGGFPGTGVSFRNHFIYAAGGYTVGTASPSLRLFDGLSDREVMALPLTAAGVVPKAIMSMALQGETIYLSTFDSGTSAADFSGRVFAFEPLTGSLTQLGGAFSSGEIPYALCFHMGRLWCGTNKGSGAGGKVYYLRPGIDTTWTLDYTLATSSVGGVCSLASYNGKLYVGSDNAAASFAQVLVRDALGAYTTSTTATGGAAQTNNSVLYLKVFNSNLYATYWNPDTPAVAKIYKFDGSSWSTVYNGAAGTIRPFIGMFESNKSLYTIGGGNILTAVLLSSSNGTSWTDLTPQLTGIDGTAVPVFGEVII